MMYVYLIKYNNQVIAAAKDDASADAVIRQYMRNNYVDISLFDKEAIRYFTEEDIDGVEG